MSSLKVSATLLRTVASSNQVNGVASVHVSHSGAITHPNETASFTSQAVTEADVNAFVRNWFRQLDDEVPVEQLLPLIDDHGLKFRLPGLAINNHADFKRTYALLTAVLGKGTVHVMEQVDSRRVDDHTFDAHNRHRWQLKVFGVVPVTIHFDEHWTVRIVDGQLRISEYVGKFV